MSNNQEKLSALLDEELETSSYENVLADINNESSERQQFSRYALIGDVMRKEQELVLGDDFANKIQSAVADLQMESAPAQAPESTVTSIDSHPSWGARIAARFGAAADSKTAKGGMQLAIAASVALVAVFGVNNMQQQDSPTSPVLTPVPLIQGLSPVSTDGLREKPSANQVTQSRINALMADHNQQLRLSDEKTNEDADKEQESKIEK